MKYRPEIDGLRAVALLPVILFHAGFASFSGGYVGVDVFFVISGYLITTIIISELDKGKFSLLTFYERRARRILPALFFVMLACLPFAWRWLLPGDHRDFGQSLLAVSTFSSNILFWIESDYFDRAAELKPLLHTWSLAIEEQYYILFPVLLMLTWRFGIRNLLTTLALLFAASVGVMYLGVDDHPTATFYLLPTRAWELLLGVFAAFFLWRRSYPKSDSLNQIASLVGIGLILYSIIEFDKSTPFPSVYTFIPTIGTLLIILTAVPGTWVQKILSLPALVGIGLISYSGYLWHQPVLAFARHRTFSILSDWTVVGLCILSMSMAYVSWRWVEKPFRDRERVGRKTIFSLSIIGIVFFAGVGTVIHFAYGFEGRSVSQYKQLDNLELGAYEFDNAKLRTDSWKALIELSGDPSYGADHNEFDRALWFSPNDERENVLLVGNSHSKDLYNVFAASKNVSEQFEIARYGAQIENLGESFFNSPNYLASDSVVLVSRYSREDLAALESITARIVADGKRLLLTHRMFSFFHNPLINEADRVVISKHEETDDIVSLVALVNEAYTAAYESKESHGDAILYRQSMDLIQQLAHKYPGVRVFDRMDYVCPSSYGCYGVGKDLSKFFYDYGHHTNEGAAFFGGVLDSTGLYRILEHTNEQDIGEADD